MDKREETRATSDFAVTCHSQGQSSAAQITDISRLGCSLTTEAPLLAAGERVRLQVPQLTRIEGRVTWADDLQAGIEFAQPLHAAVVQFIAAQAHAKSSADMILRDNFGRPIVSGEVGRRPSPRGLIDPTIRSGD